jgi:hypothetical protein
MGCCGSSASSVSEGIGSPQIFGGLLTGRQSSVSKNYAGDVKFQKLSLRDKKVVLGLKNLQMTNRFDNSYTCIKKSNSKSRHKSFVTYNMAKSNTNASLVFVASLTMNNLPLGVNAQLLEMEFFQHLDIYR